MRILACLAVVTLLSYYGSGYLKKYNIYTYIICSVISMTAIVHNCLILNGYNIKYIPVLKEFMTSINCGALAGSLFILVMYIGALDSRNKICRKFMVNRGELSIIACIFTIPHNIYYFFAYIFSMDAILKSDGLMLFASLSMFVSGIFAIAIMIPLFITSFMYFRKKMKAKKWKNLQEYAYIFYAMLFIQVISVYISKPDSLNRTISIIAYSTIFISYTTLRVRKYLAKRSVTKQPV